MEIINVLDKGYVRLVDHMGSDLSVVNSARVSYNKETDTLRNKDERLIDYLVREDHNSPFRHATLQFEVYAPLMVKNQWWKHVVGSSHQDPMLAWNESSRRYVTEDVEFYIPEVWRTKPENSKQGSGEPTNDKHSAELTEALDYYSQEGFMLYDQAMKEGIAPEQARLFLPAYAMYVRWYWTASLYGVIHFLQQRTAGDAQSEIRDYAKAVEHFTRSKFPVSSEKFLGGI